LYGRQLQIVDAELSLSGICPKIVKRHVIWQISAGIDFPLETETFNGLAQISRDTIQYYLDILKIEYQDIN
jgi:hypothetical protein